MCDEEKTPPLGKAELEVLDEMLKDSTKLPEFLAELLIDKDCFCVGKAEPAGKDKIDYEEILRDYADTIRKGIASFDKQCPCQRDCGARHSARKRK